MALIESHEIKEDKHSFDRCDIYQLYNELQFAFGDKCFIDIRAELEFETSKIYEFEHIPVNTLLQSNSEQLLQKKFDKMCRTKLVEKIDVMYIIANNKMLSNNEAVEFCKYLSKITPNTLIVLVDQCFKIFAEKFPFLCYVESYEKRFVTHYPSQILNDRLFLGNMDHAIRKDILENLQITHILNMTSKDNQLIYKDLKISYLQCPVEDRSWETIEKYFNEGINFINNALNTSNKNNNNRVLCHCISGVSRSSTIIIAYLMKIYKMSYIKAYQYTEKRRQIIEPNPGFVQQLKSFEKKINTVQPVKSTEDLFQNDDNNKINDIISDIVNEQK
eukprot:432167_1